MTNKERDKFYKIMEQYYDAPYKYIKGTSGKEILKKFPMTTQNDLLWFLERYKWKQEFKSKKIASILTMFIMLPLQLLILKKENVSDISLLFLLAPEFIAMFILAWFMMKEMIIEEKYRK